MTGVGETALSAIDRVAVRLASAGCESPRVDAELLVGHVLGASRAGLYGDSGHELCEAELAELERLVARRERREPLAYVLGRWGFRRLVLKVDRRVLVPRPETEIVVERCLAVVADLVQPRVLDVGTGSGAIALAIADEHPGARVTAIDSSEEALAVARENVALTGARVQLVRWDLFGGLPEGPWDLVVSNPPYVRPDEIDLLQPEVRDWEPRSALVGEGETEAVARSALPALRAGGALVLEAADGDAGRVAALLREVGYGDVTVTPDLAGRDRVVEGVTTSSD
jgi:release factor glutamine methyltransferase